MNAKNLVGFVVLCMASLFCLCNRAVGQGPTNEDPHKFKKFTVTCIGSIENMKDEAFFIKVGGFRINAYSYFKDKTVRFICEGGKYTIVTKCPLHEKGVPPSGNLDLVKEPGHYKMGFSQQNGIVTLKIGDECLHLNILGQNFIPELKVIYEYRYWKGDKEVGYQPDRNRFGTWGTYGDEEDAPTYRDATVTVTEGQSFLAGGLKLVFRQTNFPMQRFTVEDTEGSTLFVANVGGKSFGQVVNPTNGYSYTHLAPEGFMAGAGDVRLIRSEGKTIKYLMLTPLSFKDKSLSCQLRFWSDQPQLVAQKPDKKTF